MWWVSRKVEPNRSIIGPQDVTHEHTFGLTWITARLVYEIYEGAKTYNTTGQEKEAIITLNKKEWHN
jgi:hypothetical protein